MREGLRSGGLRKRGHKFDDDLSRDDDFDVVLSKDGVELLCEVSKSDGKSNGDGEVKGIDVENEGGSRGFECDHDGVESLCEVSKTGGKSNGNVEVKGIDVENEGGSRGFECDHDNVDWGLKDCSTAANGDGNKVDDCFGISVQEAGLGGEGEDGLSCAVVSVDVVLRSDLGAHEGVRQGRSIEDDDKSVVYGGGKADVKEENLESVTLVSSDSNLEHGVTDSLGCIIVDGDQKTECKFGEGDCGENPTVENKQGSVLVVGRVLRSRSVRGSGIREASDSDRKRKRDIGGINDENEESSRQSQEEISQVNEVPLVSDAEVENVDGKSVSNLKKKGKRGRPKKYVDSVEEEADPVCEFKVESEVEGENSSRHSVRSLKKKGKRGRPKKCVDYLEEEVVPMVESEVEDEHFGRNSVMTPKKKGKRGRPKKIVDHPAGEEIEKNQVQVSAEVDELSTDRSVRSSNKKRKRGRPKMYFNCPKVLGKPKRVHKRGRPKRHPDLPEEDVVQTKKVPFCEVGDEDEDEDDDENEDDCNVSLRNPKKGHNRGRPKRQKGDSSVKKVHHDKGQVKDERNMELSLVTAPVRKSRREIPPRRVPETPIKGVPSKKGISSDEKITSGRREKVIVNTSSKCEETSFPESKKSVKPKRVAGSAQTEKNLIRQQIVDLLLGAGWRIDYRPRFRKEYNDAVYVNPAGKTHWSVTKAYSRFKMEVEEGSYTPIPEEVLTKLFRVVSKTRSDKNKKKDHKDDIGDSSDEERGAKPRHSAAKRKPSDSKRRCALRVRQSSQGSKLASDGVVAYAGKHSVLAWMIDSGIITIDAKVQYKNSCKTKSMLEGSVTRDGIHCSCCKKVISVAEFENHAGGTLCESEPYKNLCIVNGHSLLQCLVNSWNKQQETGRTGYYSVSADGDDLNDDTCGICGDGGDLVCCDGCPSTFHHDCLSIEELPSGEWYCIYCSCKICGGPGGGGEAVSKGDDDCDTDLSSLVTCSLCDEKYHQSCIDKADVVCVDSRQPTFCRKNCEQIFERLQSLVGAKHDFEDGYSWTLLQRSEVIEDAFTSQAHKILSNSKLATALSVMDECFLPIVDPRSGIDLIRHIVYSCGCNFNRLNFSNFFTIIFERGDEVISAASIRIHGKGLAEMPFIGTRNVYRRQGMCRRLLTAIELALGSLDVEKLVIPAIPELLHTWTSVFGFKPVEESVKVDMRSMGMLVFPYTGMLQKLVSKQEFVKSTVDVTVEDVQCNGTVKNNSDGGADEPKVDNGRTSGMFDLNCVAPDVPESSSDERQPINSGTTTENCDDEVRSGVNFEETNRDKDHQDVIEYIAKPNSPKDDKSKDNAVKATEYSCDLTNLDGTKCTGVSAH